MNQMISDEERDYTSIVTYSSDVGSLIYAYYP